MRNSIRTRLNVAFVGLAIGPLLVVGIILSWQNFNTQWRQASSVQEEVARRVSVEIMAFFEELEGQLRIISQVQGLLDMHRNQQLSVLTELLFYQDAFEELILLDSQGLEQVHVSRTGLAANSLGSRAQSNEFVIPWTKREVYYSPVRIDAASGEPLMTIAIPLLNVRTGLTEKVLVAEVRIKRIWDLIEEVQVGKGQSVYVVDAEGRVVAHRSPTVVLRGTRFDTEDQSGIRRGLSDENVILAVTMIRLGEQKFSVVAEQTVYEALASARNSVLMVAITTFITLALAGGLGFWSVRQIVQPIQAIAAAARSIGNGDLSRQVEVSGRDEVGILAGAFNAMTGRLRDMLSSEQEQAAELRREIAERERVEIEIRYLQHLLQNIADSMPTALIALDTAGRVLLWNPSAEKMLGLTAERVQGQVPWDICPELARYRHLFEEVLRTEQNIRRHKERFDERNAYAFYDVSIFPLQANRIEGCVLRIDDITQRVRLEEIMFQSTKMASIGSLAAGIAHEINNPLAAMMQSAQILQRAFDTGHPRTRDRLQASGVDPENLNHYLQTRELQAYIEGIRSSGARAAKIVADLLSFSHKSPMGLVPHDLNAMVQQTLDLAVTDYDLEHGYDFRNVTVIYELSPDLPAIPCDKQQIQQVVLNLVRNAVQAMLKNTGAPPVADEPRLTLRTSVRENWVRLEVENNGPTIPKEVHARLFEPFFTTKDVGEGTGLGLWVCWSIVVERHRGRIWAEAGRVDGARFVVELPISDPTNSPDS